MSSSRPTGLLRGLTRLQHVLFALLVTIGVAQGLRGDAAPAPVVACAVALAAWYAVGATREAHRMMSAISAPPASTSPASAPSAGTSPNAAAPTEAASTAAAPTDAAPAPSPAPEPGPRPSIGRSHAIWWLLVLTLLWVACVAVAPSFIWVAFALWMLSGHLLQLLPAVAFSLLVLAVVVSAPPLHHEPWTVAGIIGPAVGALFALALSRGQVQLARDALHRAMLVESLQRVQAESAALHEELLTAQREAGAFAERTRISRDIHDTLAQGFSSILLLARGASSTGEGRAREHLLERIGQTAAAGLEESRRVVAALAPRNFSDTGLMGALQRTLDDLAADTGIATGLHVEADLPLLRTNDEVALLRCTQGALANVRQHARATRVEVSLFRAGQEIRLDIVDDGAGFDPAKVARRPQDLSRGGYGLAATRARLAELGGGLTIESAPGQGTAISVALPLSAPQVDP